MLCTHSVAYRFCNILGTKSANQREKTCQINMYSEKRCFIHITNLGFYAKKCLYEGKFHTNHIDIARNAA